MDGKKTIEIKCKGADTLPIDRILEFQGELKELSKENEKKLRNSILKFGFIAPLFVWDDKGEWRLLDGHQRLKTLIKMREEGYDIPLLPVDYIEADSEEDAKRKLLHITSQYGEFSPEGFENFTFGLDGFEDIRLTNDEFDISFLRDDDEVKDDNYEIPDEIETDIKVGDIFQIGKHRLMCGDSTDAETVAKLMDGQKADMVFTDPPYNVAFNGRSGNFDVIKNDDLTEEDFNLFIGGFVDILNYLKPKHYYIWCNWKFYGILQQLLEFKACIVWAKNVFGLGKGYRHQHEFCLFNGNIDEDVTNESDLWQVKKDSNYVHPTQKPLELSARAIKNHKAVKNVVDLFGGSGSTMMACEQLNRTCYMMELDPKYCQVIIDRMRALDGTIEIRRNGELYD